MEICDRCGELGFIDSLGVCHPCGIIICEEVLAGLKGLK